MKKLKIKYPLLVEGSYDKNRVCAIAEGTVITCDGFGVFNSEGKKAVLKRITESGKLLVLTDSDGAGKLIRGRLKGCLAAENIIDLYTPQIKGKEKRKKKPSKEGLLGVEGMSDEVLYALLAPFSEGEKDARTEPVTGAYLYRVGLSGGENSALKRDDVCRKAGLPEGLGAKAFAQAMNALGGLCRLEAFLKDGEE